ncbi:MAG: phosphoenolpyruvate synthase [Bacillota bacterium]
MKGKIIPFAEIEANNSSIVGGKGVNLGKLVQSEINVPEGFCITTDVFEDYTNKLNLWDRIDHLNSLKISDTEKIKNDSCRLRNVIQNLTIKEEFKRKIHCYIERIDINATYAIRSSATMEDSPTTSFAGQHGSYLNIKGINNIIDKIKSCWSSLYSERAVSYRIKNNIDQTRVKMAVLIQKMVFPDKSGILFTADPVTNNRNIITIDAGFGLGEALVSGLITPDTYKVTNQNLIISRNIGKKKLAIKPDPGGGTYKEKLNEEFRDAQVLNNKEIIELSRIGKKIESFYQNPQDIEWCIAENDIFITQTRPITSLFPVPDTPDDNRYHVFVSLNHIQVMTESIKPLGQSLIRILFPFGKDKQIETSQLLLPAGGRLYIDVTYLLSTWPLSKILPAALGIADKLIADALKQVINQDKFKNNSSAKGMRLKMVTFLGPILIKTIKIMFLSDNNKALARVEKIVETKISEVKEKMNNCQDDLTKIKAIEETVSTILLDLFKQVLPFLLAGMISFKYLDKIINYKNNKDEDYLVQKLASGLKGNITTRMGLEIGDLTDKLRQNEELIQILKDKPPEISLSEIKEKGNQEIAESIEKFFDKYGRRGISEIDISRKRYKEDPSPIVKSILNNIANYESGEHRKKYKKLEEEAEQAARKILNSIDSSPINRIKSISVKRLIKNIRQLLPLREHPKYTLISCLDIYKDRILEIAENLQKKDIICENNDIFYLKFSEIREILRNNKNYKSLIESRKENHQRYQKLTPPRVITGEGEIIKGKYKTDNKNQITGTPVSSGRVEGKARVVLDPEQADIEKGDILVVPFTDPGWTPLFVNAAGLVMEVGGLMTHGAVVAREYGLPAVVGVENATKLIQNGEKIKIDGDSGFIQKINE